MPLCCVSCVRFFFVSLLSFRLKIGSISIIQNAILWRIQENNDTHAHSICIVIIEYMRRYLMKIFFLFYITRKLFDVYEMSWCASNHKIHFLCSRIVTCWIQFIFIQHMKISDISVVRMCTCVCGEIKAPPTHLLSLDRSARDNPRLPT